MSAIRGTRGFLSCLQSILALVWLPATPISAAQAPANSVEFPVWSRTWLGTLGSKQVEIALNRTADGLQGSYCYQPCSAQTRSQLVLTGRMRDETAAMEPPRQASGISSR